MKNILITVLLFCCFLANAQDNYHRITEQMLAMTYGLQNGTWVNTASEIQNLEGDSQYGNLVLADRTIRNQDFTQATTIVNQRERDYGYDAGWKLPNQGIVREGNVCLLVLNLRKTSNLGKVTVLAESVAEKFPEELMTIHLFDEWTQYLIPFQSTQTYQGDDLNILIQVGWEIQTVEVAGVNILNFGNQYSLDRLPLQIHNDRYIGSETNAPWRNQAAQRIEQVRKSNMTIAVADRNGNPIENAQVSVNMLEHEFKWGVEIALDRIAGNIRHVEQYEARLLDMDKQGHRLNWVVPGNSFKWPGWESNWMTSPSEKVKAVEWLLENDFKIRQHTVVWPSWDNSPADIQTYANNPNRIRNRIWGWIEILTSELGLVGTFEEYDILNETVTSKDFEESFANTPGYTTGRELYGEIMEKFAAEAPNAPQVINDYVTISKQQYKGTEYNELQNILQEVLDRGAPLSGIGFQAHIDVFPTSILEVERVLTDFGNRFNLPLKITEYDTPIAMEKEIAGQYLADFLTMVFSLEQVDMFMFWGFWDGYHWKDNGNFYDLEWNLKPAGQVAFDKIFNEWWTEETRQTNRAGSSTFRPFKGQHEIVINYEGQIIRDTVFLNSDESFSYTLSTSTTDLSGKYRIRNVWRDKYLTQGNEYDSNTIPLNEDWQSQIWEVEKGADGIYRLQCKWKDWYLNVGRIDNGAPAHAYPLNENWKSQMWYLEPVGDGTFRIKNRWSNRYLHAGSNERVTINDLRTDWTSQMWVLEPTNSCNANDANQLKQVAAEVGVKFGTLLEPQIIDYRPLYDNQISAGTVTTYWKYSTHAEEGRYTWEEADTQVSLGELLGLDLRGHPLVWGSDEHIPNWVKAKPRSEGESILLEHIGEVAGRYAGKIKSWDVVNEAINDDGTFRNSYWNQAMTAEYIIKAFRKAHQTAPSADLVYNDYGMETNRQKFEGVKNLLAWLQSENVGLTALGWQLHVNADDVLKDNFALADYMAEISAMGLENIVTELDVRILDTSPAQLERQKQAYKKITQIFLNNATRGDYLITWGLSDRYTWWNNFDTSRIHYPNLFDNNLEKKPAFWGVYEAFQEYENTPLPSTGSYRLKNVWKNKYLTQSADYEGAPTLVQSLNPNWLSQRWELEEISSGIYRLSNHWTNWKLNIGSTENNAIVGVYPLREDWQSQLWYLEPVGNGVYRLKNQWSNRYLNARAEDDVAMYDLNEAWESQMWLLEPINDFTGLDTSSETTGIIQTSNPPTFLSKLESTISPNPVHSEATVIFSEAAIIKKVQLFNVTGHQFKVEWEQPQSDLCQLYLETLPAGLYVVKIETTNRLITNKLFKMRH